MTTPQVLPKMFTMVRKRCITAQARCKKPTPLEPRQKTGGKNQV